MNTISISRLVIGVALLGASLDGAAAGEAKSYLTLINTQGKEIGSAQLTELANGVAIHLQAKGLPPGLKGMHLHENGKCDPPDFKSAGGHFNPGNAEHGRLNPKGAHLGDLPNLEVKKNGQASVRHLIRGATLKAGKNSLFKAGGTALIIHAGPDDLSTDPAGGSGDRIACGVIARRN